MQMDKKNPPGGGRPPCLFRSPNLVPFFSGTHSGYAGPLQSVKHFSNACRFLATRTSGAQGTVTWHFFAASGHGMNYPIEWVKLSKYVEITGDSADSVHARRKAGKWLDGDQCKIVDGNLWVNLRSVERWVETWGQIKPVAAAAKAGRRQ